MIRARILRYLCSRLYRCATWLSLYADHIDKPRRDDYVEFVQRLTREGASGFGPRKDKDYAPYTSKLRAVK